VAFVMLNPSTADDTTDDATIRSCTRLAKKWQYGALIVVNTNPNRSTNPKLTPEPTEFDLIENDEYLRRAAFWGHRIVLAWGNHVDAQLRDRALEVLEETGHDLFHLGLTKKGEPKHPLYLPATTTLERWREWTV